MRDHDHALIEARLAKLRTLTPQNWPVQCSIWNAEDALAAAEAQIARERKDTGSTLTVVQ